MRTRLAFVALAALFAACRSSAPLLPPSNVPYPPLPPRPAPSTPPAAAATPAPAPAPVPPPPPPPVIPVAIVPAPVSLVRADSTGYFAADSLTTSIVVAADGSDALVRTGRMIARLIGRDTASVRRLAPGATPDSNTILLAVDRARVQAALPGAMSAEAYVLEVTPSRVTLAGASDEGVFRAASTLRQLFPVAIEHRFALTRRLRVPLVQVADAPRFGWRGSMLDVSRHFLPLEDVKRHVDLMAYYKLNHLHLHLSDDQGWRIEIRKYPDLARIGGSSAVGGPPGGYYTQAQFRELVRYAQERYVDIVPEIDMPAHTNAALASLGFLNCDGKRTPRYTGIMVGFSALCVADERTYRWIDDVVGEIAAMSPSPYFHMGGDEVARVAHPEYVAFVERVQAIVHRHGKRLIGWDEVASANLDTTSVAQLWRGGARDSTFRHAERGGKIIMSPGSRAYFDMKHDTSTVLGLRWAGMVDLRTAYDWNPAAFQPGIAERDVLGVEAPVWSETLVTYDDFEFLLFPRLLAMAEVGWTPQASRSWDDFRTRVALHGPRMQALGINFHRSPLVEWTPAPAPVPVVPVQTTP